jgi:ABC-type amino acid transport/signal transduction systems, periplasmic component/domain
MEKNWIKIIGVVVLVIIVSVITVKLLGSSSPSTTLGYTVYDRVIKSGTIHACYVAYVPAFIVDPKTNKLSGIFYDTLNKAAENMGLKVDWNINADWGTQIQNLNSDKCDIVGSDSWSNSTRARSAEFITPLYYSGINAYARSNDGRFSTDPLIANDPKYTVVYEDGETSQVIVKQEFPNAKTISVPQTADASEMLLNVVSNKVDMAFVDPAIANQFLATHPGAIKNVSVAKPVVVYGNVMMVKKGEFALQQMVNGAINELLGNGYVDQVIDQYAKQYPGVYYRVSLPYTVPQ